MTSGKMIVFAPHPDDETLGCGGTIVRKLEEGYDVHVVIMTDGRHSHDLIFGIKEPPPETMARIRAKETSEAMAILGVPSHNLISLGFEDSKLMQHQPKAAERIVQILLEIRPVEAYVTYRDDFNEDHRVTHAIVKHSVRETGLLTKIYEYPVWNKKVPGPDLKVVLMDIHNELGKKMEAISKYASQISRPFPGQERAVLSEDFLKMFCSDKELFYTEEC